jgi:glycogen synthase
VEHLSADGETGNGFLFETYDTGGLVWAVDEAMRFFDLPEPRRDRTVARIMADSRQRFNHPVTARHYIALYEKMLQRPLITAA